MSKELKNKFDQSIRDAVGNHQVPYDDASWDLLEERMSRMDAQGDSSVDEMAREAVGKLEVPYSPVTWEVLSERLDRINYRRRLIASKVFEAAVIFFAIFTMVKFLGQIPEVRELLPQSLTERNSVENMDRFTDDSNLNAASADKVFSHSTENALVQESEVDQTEKDNNSSKNDLGGSMPLLPLRQQSVSVASSVRSVVLARSVSEPHSIQSLDLALQTSPPALDRKKDVQRQVPMLPVYDMSMLQAETAHDFHVVASVPKSRIQTKIGTFYQHNRHELHRFVNGSLKPQVIYPKSDGLGFVANIQFGRLGFDLGTNYSELEYDAGFGTSKVEKIQIPLNLRYILSETQYADFYALAGASAHAVLRANYATPALEASAPDAKPRPKYNDGLLEGGFKEGNTYYSINAGFGVDIPITKNLGLFSEVIYQQHWRNRIGYTDDKITTYSLNLGVTTKL